MGWDIVPWGFEKLLSWIQKEYSPKGGILVSWNHLNLSNPLKWKVVYGSGSMWSMWHFLHFRSLCQNSQIDWLDDSMLTLLSCWCARIQIICMSSKQSWTTVIAESLGTSGLRPCGRLRPPAAACGPRWLKMAAPCERQRKKKPWMTAVGRTEKSATLNLTYKGDGSSRILLTWKSVAQQY